MTRVAEGETLDKWANLYGTSRTYYGSNKRTKPNNNCFWDEAAYVAGWYETDDHFRTRIHNRLTRKEVTKP